MRDQFAIIRPQISRNSGRHAGIWLWVLVIGSTLYVSAQDQLQLQILPRPGGLEVRMPSAPEPPVAGTKYENLKLERSQDLVHWESAGDLQIGKGIDGFKSLLLDGKETNAFFRVQGNLSFSSDAPDGSEVFGYNKTFQRELRRIGQISLEDFARMYPQPDDYLSQIGFDPTNAAFWADYNIDPRLFNQNPSPGKHLRFTDYRLNDKEFAIFRTNGFVVSARLGSYSFADAFYRIWIDELPVFVSSDAILHAWHRSYGCMLEELEELYLSNLLTEMLLQIQMKVPDIFGDYGNGVLRQEILDADYYLSVARSLLLDVNLGGWLHQESRVAQTLAAIKAGEVQDFKLFGQSNTVDFSQYRPRGHYNNSNILKKYFQAMMWLGRIDFRIAGDSDAGDARQLGIAIVLNYLLRDSGQLEVWRQMDQIIQNFVGWTDFMTLPQLNDLLSASGIHSPADVTNSGVLTNLQSKILSGQLGVQQIRSDYYFSPLGP